MSSLDFVFIESLFWQYNHASNDKYFVLFWFWVFIGSFGSCTKSWCNNRCLPIFQVPLYNTTFLFLGLCKIVSDKTPYHSIEEITRKVSIGPTRLGHPCFYCNEDVKLANLAIKQGEQIMFNSVEEVNGTLTVNCGVVRDNQSHSFTLPLSQEGEFYECEDDHIYTLKEIVEWKIPRSRNRIVKFTNMLHTWDSSNPLPENFDGCLILAPIYEVQGVMKCK